MCSRRSRLQGRPASEPRLLPPSARRSGFGVPRRRAFSTDSGRRGHSTCQIPPKRSRARPDNGLRPFIWVMSACLSLPAFLRFHGGLMPKRRGLFSAVILALVAGGLTGLSLSRSAAGQTPTTQPPRRARDAVAEAQTPKDVPAERVEQKKTAHDLSDVFTPSKASPSSEALVDQPQHGGMTGFDFYRDPLGAMAPGTTFDEIYKTAVANKPKVTALQRKLLESRYDLAPKLDPKATMSRGKPLVVGPTARLPQGTNWDALAAMSPEEIRTKDAFPYKALPHPAQGGGLGGQVFPQMQTKMFPRLERYDVEYDLPEAFLPEFPPAMYLQNRPELGDVSRGEVVSINN